MGGAFVRPPKFSKLIKYFEKSSLFIVVVLEELMCISILLHIAWRAPQPLLYLKTRKPYATRY